MRFAGDKLTRLSSPLPPSPLHSRFGEKLIPPYEGVGNNGVMHLADAQFTADMVNAAANGGVSGSGARLMSRSGVGGGGAAIGSEQLEDIYLNKDDSDFGTYDPAERSFFPGV